MSDEAPPKKVVIFEVLPLAGLEVGSFSLRLAAAAHRLDGSSILLVDADPYSRLTLAANQGTFQERPENIPNLEDYLDAAAALQEAPDVVLWNLTRRGRRLLPSGGDALAAHGRALGAQVATGGLLDLRDRVDNLLWPQGQGIHLSLVLAPPLSTGLGMLLGGLADVVLLIGDGFGFHRAVNDIVQLCKVADPFGPTSIIPVLPTGGPRVQRPSTPPELTIERGVRLTEGGTAEELTELARRIQGA